jgi:hypothetical protein
MDNVVQPVGDPHRFVVRLDADAVVRVAYCGPHLLHLYGATAIREVDPMDFFPGREIGHYKPMKLAEARQYPFRRTVRIRVERQWTRPIREFDRSDSLFRLLIDNCNSKGPIIRSSDDVFPIGRHVCVVNLQPIQWQSFCVCQASGVDDVHTKRFTVDRLI